MLEGRELDRYRKLCRSGIRLVFAGDVPASMPPFSYDTCVAANESENGRAAGKLLAAEVLRRGGSCLGFLYGSAQSFCTRQRDHGNTRITHIVCHPVCQYRNFFLMWDSTSCTPRAIL